MDPQSFVFTPQNDVWRISNTMRTFQETQQEHADRLMRLERRQDEDARVKSVWGPSSPFPSVLGGTPQQGPLHQPSNMDFEGFDDDQPASMVRSLHLDADDEPRRLGAASRANSVRFDESANQTLWSHASKPSIDFPRPRSASSFGVLGGHPLYDRSGSHRSDGRQSSVGHSMSGRANSFGLDTLQSTPSEPPGLTPGLFILGSVPSIIRCWLDTNFKHDGLLYAAVCTGSYKSYLDIRLIHKLGFTDRMSQDINGDTKIKLSMYLPEAVVHPASSRSNSPAPQLPAMTVDFSVVDSSQGDVDDKAIQIFLGSDTLRAHNTDILFSSNTMTLYDDDRNKLSLPLVRPENDETFKTLYTTSMAPPHHIYRRKAETYRSPRTAVQYEPMDQGNENYADIAPRNDSAAASEQRAFDEPSESQPGALGISTPEPNILPQGRDNEPSLPAINTSTKSSSASPDHSPTIMGASRTGSSPAIWSGNWRRENSNAQQSSTSDWTSSSRQNSAAYTRPNRDQGIKVLKPSRQITRSTSSAGLAAASPTSASPGQSRYFDEGKRKSGATSMDEQQARRSLSGEASKNGGATLVGPQGSKLRSVNPVGGASAFGWLNSGQAK